LFPTRPSLGFRADLRKFSASLVSFLLELFRFSAKSGSRLTFAVLVPCFVFIFVWFPFFHRGRRFSHPFFFPCHRLTSIFREPPVFFTPTRRLSRGIGCLCFAPPPCLWCFFSSVEIPFCQVRRFFLPLGYPLCCWPGRVPAYKPCALPRNSATPPTRFWSFLSLHLLIAPVVLIRGLFFLRPLEVRAPSFQLGVFLLLAVFFFYFEHSVVSAASPSFVACFPFFPTNFQRQ